MKYHNFFFLRQYATYKSTCKFTVCIWKFLLRRLFFSFSLLRCSHWSPADVESHGMSFEIYQVWISFATKNDFKLLLSFLGWHFWLNYRKSIFTSWNWPLSNSETENSSKKITFSLTHVSIVLISFPKYEEIFRNIWNTMHH